MRVRNSSSSSNNNSSNNRREKGGWDRSRLRRMSIILVEEGEGVLMGMLRLRGDYGLYMLCVFLEGVMGMILGMVTVMG